MLGASSGRGVRMRTWPRLVGFRLHTLAVNALNGCSGSPKASRDSGCTWYSRSGHGLAGSLRVNAPSCDGAMLIGPLRVTRYSRPISALPHHERAIVLSVFTPSTPYTARI